MLASHALIVNPFVYPSASAAGQWRHPNVSSSSGGASQPFTTSTVLLQGAQKRYPIGLSSLLLFKVARAATHAHLQCWWDIL